MAQPPQGVPQQPMGGGFSQIIPVLERFAGTSEPDPLTKMFMEAVIKSGLENMYMGSALMKAYVMKVAPSEFADAMKSVETKMETVKGSTEKS